MIKKIALPGILLIGALVFFFLTKHQETYTPAVPSNWSTFEHDYGYSFSHPEDSNFFVDDLYDGDAYHTLPNISVRDSAGGYLIVVKAFDKDNLYENASEEYRNWVSLDLREFAEAAWEENKNDTNPNIPEKTTGDFTEESLAGKTAYSFTVTHSFVSPSGGGIAPPDGAKYYFVEDESYKYMFVELLGNPLSNEVFQSLTFGAS